MLIPFGDADLSTWGALIGSVGFPTVIGFYLVYKGIPEIISKFITEQKETRAHYDEKSEKRTIENSAALAVVIGHCEKESMRHDDRARSDMALVSKSMEAHGEVLEEVRDELRSLRATRANNA